MADFTVTIGENRYKLDPNKIRISLANDFLTLASMQAQTYNAAIVGAICAMAKRKIDKMQASAPRRADLVGWCYEQWDDWAETYSTVTAEQIKVTLDALRSRQLKQDDVDEALGNSDDSSSSASGAEATS